MNTVRSRRDLAADSCTWMPLVRCIQNYRDVIASAAELVARIVNSETAGIMVYEPERGELVLQAPAFGVSDDLAALYRVRPTDGGNAIHVFTSGRYHLSNDCFSDPIIIQRYAQLYRARSLVTVPMRLEGHNVGVIHALNNRRGYFTRRDAALLMTAAAGVGIVVQQARQIDKIQKQVQDLMQQVDRSRRLVHAAADLVKALSGAKSGLSAHELGKWLGRPVAVYDLSGEPVVSWGKPFPQLAFHRPRVVKSQPPASRPLPPEEAQSEHRLMLAAIGPEEGPWGWLAVDPSDGEIDEFQELALHYAAAVMAMLLHRDRQEETLAELVVHVHSSWIRDILESDNPDHPQDLARKLSSTPSGCYLAIVLLPEKRYARSVLELAVQLRGLLQETVAASVVAVIDDEVVLALVPLADHTKPRRIVDRVVGGCKGSSDKVKVAFARIPAQPTTLRANLRVIRDFAQLWRQASGNAETVELEDIWPLREMFSIRAETLFAMVQDVLGRLLSLPSEERQPLLHAAEAYVAHGFSIKQASASLYIHASTLKYRLGRLEDALRISLTDWDSRFRLALALRAYRLLRAIGTNRFSSS